MSFATLVVALRTAAMHEEGPSGAARRTYAADELLMSLPGRGLLNQEGARAYFAASGLTIPFDRWWSDHARIPTFFDGQVPGGTLTLLTASWTATLTTGSGPAAVDLGPAQSQATTPREQVTAEALDVVEAQGWTLVHVSEDHGLVTTSAGEESTVVRTRYLLRR